MPRERVRTAMRCNSCVFRLNSRISSSNSSSYTVLHSPKIITVPTVSSNSSSLSSVQCSRSPQKPALRRIFICFFRKDVYTCEEVRLFKRHVEARWIGNVLHDIVFFAICVRTYGIQRPQYSLSKIYVLMIIMYLYTYIHIYMLMQCV